MSPGKKDGCRVNVYVRSRPLPLDDPAGISSLLFPDVNKVIIQDVKHDTIYKFDHVFPLDSTNAEVCKVVSEPLVSAVFSGNNGSFLVYGQTGAGKTHTVLYTGGVIPTTIEHIFDIIKNSDHCTYKVFLSYLQIYQERIYDLLLNGYTGPLTLREHPREGIIIEGLSEEEVTSEEDAKKLIEIGQKKLIVTHTKASPFSSRSHAVCILKVCKYFSYSEITPEIPLQVAPENRPESPVQYESGKLNICDLAGTERSTKLRTASGRHLDESRHINTSLLELGNVIHALATKNKPYIPFRNSCLTRILQDSLVGNSKASLMVCISASVNDLKETKCSLNFGQRAMKVMKETIANSEPQVDPQWLRNSFTRKKLKKTDYKILSKYLTSKLKELELAYKLEKENLDALKRYKGKKRENPDGSLDENLDTSTPFILKRSLGVLTEEFGSREEVTHNTVDTGINTDTLDTCFYEHKSNTLNYSTPQYVSSTCQMDFDTCPGKNKEDTEPTELITINETMSESLLIEHIFHPEDTLPFQMVEPAVTECIACIDKGTEMDGVNVDINSSTNCIIEEFRDDETQIITYNVDYISSQESIEPNYVGQNTETTSERQDIDTISIGVGTSFEDIQHLNFNRPLSSKYAENTSACNQLFEFLTETLPDNIGDKTTLDQSPNIVTKEITTLSDKEIQTNRTEETFTIKESYVDITHGIPRDIKTYSNASTQVEFSNSDEISVTNVITSENATVAMSSCDLTSLKLEKRDKEQMYNVTEDNDNAINIQFGTIKSSNEPNIVVCNNMKDSNLPLTVQFENIEKIQCDKSKIHVHNGKPEENTPCLEQTENQLCNVERNEVIMEDKQFSEYHSEKHLQNGKTDDEIAENLLSLEQYEYRLCNNKTDNNNKDNMPFLKQSEHDLGNGKSEHDTQCLEQSEVQLCNSKTAEDIMEDMQSLELFEKHLSNGKTEEGIMENMHYLKEQSEKRSPNGKTDDNKMEDMQCLQSPTEKHLRNDTTNNHIVDEPQCFEQSKTHLRNGKTAEEIMEDMQSLELFEKNLSNNKTEEGIMENMQYLKEQSEKCLHHSKTVDSIMDDMQCLESQTKKHLRYDKINVDIVDDTQSLKQSETHLFKCNTNDHNMEDIPCLEESEKGKADVIEDTQCNAIKSDSIKLALEEQFENVVNVIKDLNIAENIQSNENNYDTVDSSINDKKYVNDTVYSIEFGTTKMATSIEPSAEGVCSNTKYVIAGNIQVNKNNTSTNSHVLVNQCEKETYHIGSTNSDVLVNLGEIDIYHNGSTNSDVIVNRYEKDIYHNGSTNSNVSVNQDEKEIYHNGSTSSDVLVNECEKEIYHNGSTRSDVLVNECEKQIYHNGSTNSDVIGNQCEKEIYDESANSDVLGNQGEKEIHHNGSTNSDVLVNQCEKEIYHKGSTNSDVLVNQGEKEIYHNGSTNSDVLVNQCEKEICHKGSTNSDVLVNQCEKGIHHNANDDIACDIHNDNIDNDIVVQEEIKEQFVDQLSSYIWENMDFDSAAHDKIDDTRNHHITQVHDSIMEIKVDNITGRDDIDFEIKENKCNVEMLEQQSQKYLYHDAKNNHKLDIVDYTSENTVSNITKKKDINFADVNDNDITEIHVNDVLIKFNNKKDMSNKREICVQTDVSCIRPKQQISSRYSNGQNGVPSNKGGYLPPESDEERERFMNRFCYSASQHLTGDMDFEYREAKYMTNTGDQDELYQGCLVYLTDTDSVSDYSEISEDSSLFSDFTKCDGDYDETLQAKLLMENIKNKYEMLLNDFELVSSERSRLQGESTRKRSCYDLLTNFKSALEEELSKLGEHSGRSSVSDSNESRSCFSPSQILDQSSRLSRDISKQASLLGIQGSLKPVKRNQIYSGDTELLKLERTSPDGAQQKTPAKNLSIMGSLDENNNIENVIDFSERQRASSPCVPGNGGQKEVSKSNKSQTDHSLDRYHPLKHTPTKHKSSVSLEGTTDVSIHSKISSPSYRSLSLQEHSIDTSCGLATTEHEKLKRELLLTKLEKSRLEAVLSCVLLKNDFDIDNDSNLKNLTTSRSTLSSSTSMAQLPKLSRTSSPFQTIAFPLRSYSYTDRRFATPDSLPALSNLAQVVRSRQRSRARSIPEADGVGNWLSQDNANSISELSQDGSTISPASSFAEITSMSDIDTPCASTQQLHPLKQDKEELLEDLSLDKDMDDVDIDSLLEQLQKKEKFPLACVPFIKRRSIRKKLKKAKKLYESQSSGIS